MGNVGAIGSQAARPAQTTQQGSASTAAPLSPFSSATTGLLASPDWTNAVSGYLSGQAAPGLAQSLLGAATGSAGLGMVGPQLGVSEAELQANQGYTLANALLGYEGIGLESQGLASQAGTAAKQQGLEEAEYGVQSGIYPEQEAQAALANKNAVEAEQRSSAVGGTYNTTGHKERVATQAQEYGWQQADIFRNQQLAQLGQQSEEAGYAGQEEQFANQRAQLALAAQGEGLSAGQSQAQLGFGLQQLGVNASPEQFLGSIANAQGAGAQSLSALLSQAALIGGLGPSFGQGG